MAFGRRRVERPKNFLGYALYRFDNIFNKDLKNIIKAVKAKKKLNPVRVSAVIDNAFFKIDGIIDDISVDNFKTDYRSDKVRYIIIDLLTEFKKFFEMARENNYNPLKMTNKEEQLNLEGITEIRGSLKSKMKDIESDYL